MLSRLVRTEWGVCLAVLLPADQLLLIGKPRIKGSYVGSLRGGPCRNGLTDNTASATLTTATGQSCYGVVSLRTLPSHSAGAVCQNERPCACQENSGDGKQSSIAEPCSVLPLHASWATPVQIALILIVTKNRRPEPAEVTLCGYF